MKFNKRLEEIRTYFGTENAGLEKILELSNGYISNLEKEGTNNPGKLLVELNKKGISTDWFLTGEGEMLLEKRDIKPEPISQIPKLGNLIDQRLEKIEARIAEIEDYLKKSGTSHNAQC